MKKLLYISNFIMVNVNGANKLCLSHLNAIYNIFGKDKVDVISLNSNQDLFSEEYECIKSYSNKMEKIRNLIQLNNVVLNNKIIDYICEKVNKEKYSYVFIDNSTFGKLVRALKERTNTIVLSFYHDVKKNLYKDWVKARGIKFFPSYVTQIYNEKINAKYVDVNITLNKRETQMLEMYYNTSCERTLPICLKDNFSSQYIKKESKSEHIKLLFVGVYYYPNVQGIEWFCENVMSAVNDNIKLYIVGRGMEKLKEKLSNDKVIVVGEVDDLGEYYKEADIVVAPIFKGAGMKVKTAEAMMYGKNILATNEALEGYEEAVELSNGNIIACNKKEEFLEAIYKLEKNLKPFNENIRNLFINNYSENAEKRILIEILEKSKNKNYI